MVENTLLYSQQDDSRGNRYVLAMKMTQMSLVMIYLDCRNYKVERRRKQSKTVNMFNFLETGEY